MSMSRFVVAGLLAAVSVTFVGCGQRDLNYRTVEVEELKRQVRDLEAELDACEKRGAMKDIATLGPVADTDLGKERVIGHGVEVGERPMETYIRISDSILFKPGSARLSTEAKATLSRIIEVIHEKYPHRHVRVDGFTDNEPIVRSKDKWDDNFDLSGGRALSVLHYLEAHGVAKVDLGFAGFGAERPRVPNSTEANRAKNRRVEIVIGEESHDEDVPEETAPESSSHHHATSSTHHRHTTHHTTSTTTPSTSSSSSTEPTTGTGTTSSAFGTTGSSGGFGTTPAPAGGGFGTTPAQPPATGGGFGTTPAGGGFGTTPTTTPPPATSGTAGSGTLSVPPGGQP